MDNEELENRYANHNKLVVDSTGRLVYMHQGVKGGLTTTYQVTGVSEKLTFTLKRISVK